MKYKIIAGRFYVSGYSPDGDSIRFQADNPIHWEYLNWKKENNKKRKKKQLRFEAIDALETHYKESHQPKSFGIAALEELLKMIKIKNISYNIAMTKIVSAEDGKKGYIATSSLDVYDRPVCITFSNIKNFVDGEELDLKDLPLNKSVNLLLLKLGLVYPTFYSSMQQELIKTFSIATKKARKKKIGIWVLDKTSEFTLWNKDTIQHDIIILPKLFRRLTAFFFKENSYDELNNYLKRTRDKILIISTNEIKKMHEIIEIDGRKIKFLEKPENIIFNPKK